MPLLHRLSPIFRPKRRKNEMHVCAPINRLGVLRSPTQALPPTWISLFLTRISNLLSDTLSVCPRNLHETSGPSVHETFVRAGYVWKEVFWLPMLLRI
jgi:hypothetical protein